MRKLTEAAKRVSKAVRTTARARITLTSSSPFIDNDTYPLPALPLEIEDGAPLQAVCANSSLCSVLTSNYSSVFFSAKLILSNNGVMVVGSSSSSPSTFCLLDRVLIHSLIALSVD
ncbi:hypothetical protein PIB30_069248 [Stylosanthes scabra]|uniref:Uncharacterized protein n=1 Tax=Stylosanthes scabra TaxID=79078 RepID=A0ABU6YM18_9FABA|nr:hypothetical protein [Stylosanthes scabra]